MKHIRPYRKWFVLLLTSIVVGEVCGLIIPWFYKRFFDTLTQSGVPSIETGKILIMILLVIFGLSFAKWFGYRGVNWINNYLQPRIMADLEQTSFAYLLHHSYRFFSNSFAGSLVRKVRRLSRAFEDLMDCVAYKFIPIAITLVGSLVALGMRSLFVAMVTCVWFVIFISINYAFAMWKLSYDQRRAAKDSEVTGVLSDALSNSVNIDVFAGHTYEQSLYKKVTEEFRRMQMFTWNLAEINDAIQWGLMIVIETAVMFFAVRLWVQGQITIGDFALFQGYLVTLFERMWDLGRVIRRTYESFADAKEMVEILETPHEICDVRNAKPLHVTRGEITFQDVVFSHHKTRKVMDKFTMTIRPKEKVALVGPSGAGKSTITKLILRFYDIDKGKICIDGQDIRRVTQDSLHQAIALVPQEPILFHRTIMENIRYGRLEATDEEVIEAAKKAQCHTFIEEMPEGYQTFVGERGVKLSGGERQRVAIARAILKDVPILILDEATSSLDSESETLIQGALAELMKGKTAIVVAHRLSTILKMDRIIVIDHGKVAAAGTHTELIQTEGLYKKLWEIQAGGFLSEPEVEEEEE